MPASPSAAPERWHADAGSADVATLTIPPDAVRDRRFEIFCRYVVAARGDGAAHAMRVEVDGALEWTRREPTHAGASDSLEYRFGREVPAGQPLRVRVKTQAERAARLKLTIEAEEQ
jgi:hypothetical protein